MKKLLQSSGFEKIAATLIAIIAGLLFGLIIMLIINPSQAFGGLGAILTAGFLNGGQSIGDVLFKSAPLILVGLAVAFAFKTGLFNIGVSGQLMMGALAAVYVGVKWNLPPSIHWLVALLAGILGGVLWALVPALLKAFRNVHEVVATIMMNYIAMFTSKIILLNVPGLYNVASSRSSVVATGAQIPQLGLNVLFDLPKMNSGIVIAIIATIIIYVLLERTTFGYQLKAVGFNRNAARYAGINDRSNIVYSLLISGALAGLAGAIMYLGPGNGLRLEAKNVISPFGFQGIAVALLGMSNPFGTMAAGMFFGYIQAADNELQSWGFNLEIIDIINSSIIYFSAFSLFFQKYASKIRDFFLNLGKSKEKEESVPEVKEVTSNEIESVEVVEETPVVKKENKALVAVKGFFVRFGRAFVRFFVRFGKGFVNFFKTLPSDTKTFFKELPMRLKKHFTVKRIIIYSVFLVVYILLAIFTTPNMYSLLRLTMFSVVPLALVAMGGLYSERSGVVNIALEGTMMFGAFIGILTLSNLQARGIDGQHILFFAVIIGGVAGAVFSLLHAFASITMKSNQTISGTALNMLALALAIFLGRALSSAGTEEINFDRNYPIASIPLLKDIPFIGPIFFGKNVYLITIFGVILFFVMAIIAYKTKFGLRLRACGENPHAADAAGINVIKTRYAGVLISGLLAGLSGVMLIVPTTISFNANVYGFGFLALAVLISGQWKPGRVFIFAIFFGLLRGLSSGIAYVQADVVNIKFLSDFLAKLPTDILEMLPYVFTLFVLAITSLKSRAPKASGEPYDQGKR